LRNSLTAASFRHPLPQGLARARTEEVGCEEARAVHEAALAEAVHQGWHRAADERPVGYAKVLAGSPAKVVTREPTAADTVLLIADDQAQIEASMPAVVKSLSPSSTLWVAYRKGDKTFHRDTLAKLVEKFGFTAVALVAVDDAWSALRVKKL
jgi:hypothetical protein